METKTVKALVFCVIIKMVEGVEDEKKRVHFN